MNFVHQDDSQEHMWDGLHSPRSRSTASLLCCIYMRWRVRKSSGAQVTVQTYSKDRECGDLQGIPWEVPGTKTNTLGTNLWTQMMLPVSLTLATLRDLWPPVLDCNTCPCSGPQFKWSNKAQRLLFTTETTTWVQTIPLPPGHLFYVFNFSRYFFLNKAALSTVPGITSGCSWMKAPSVHN